MTNHPTHVSVGGEKQAFEAAYIDHLGLRLEDYDLSFDQTLNRYSDDDIQSAWWAWQARGALPPPPQGERKQQAKAAFEDRYSRSAEDPSSAESLEIWLDAWNARGGDEGMVLRELKEIRERLQNSINWMMEGKHTGLLVGTGDFMKLVEWLDALAASPVDGRKQP